jgi:DNA polymerase-3 subunit epsilon
MRDRMIAFDLEATRLDPLQDHIVELAMVRVQDGLVLLHEQFHPGIPIPQAATAVHGISDTDVAHSDPFSLHAREIQAIVDSAVLVGYGSHRYDTIMLDAELRRAGEPGIDLTATPEVDLLRVWTASEPRNLATAVRRFLGHGHEGAHRSLTDAEALVPLLNTMKRMFGLEDYDLVHLSRPRGEVDRSQRLKMDARGEVVFAFGRHAGEPVREHEEYLEWMLESDFPPDTKAVIQQLRENAWRWP